MGIRKQQKTSSITILPGLALDLNPFAQTAGSARVLRNFIPERGRIARKTFSPDFTVAPTPAGGDVWHLRNYRYTRASAQENKLLILREDGKVYERQSSYEQELFPSLAESSTTGADAAATSVSIVGGDVAWTNPTDIATSNDTRATVTLGLVSSSQVLRVDNLGFAVPATSAIRGVIVTVEGNETTLGAPITWEANLLMGGSRVGTAKTGWNFGTSDSTVSLGATNDLWGTSLLASDVNGTGFGVDVRVTVGGFGGAANDFAVDYISVTVFYGTPGTPLLRKPFAQSFSNRFFFSDGIQQKVYDGRGAAKNWGIPRTTTVPVVTAQNLAGSIVAATGVKGAYTWVELDEAGNRVHESSRSNLNASFVVIGGVDDSVRLDITGITPPARATHWSAYISELDGSEVLRRAATTAIATVTVDITAFPAATAAKAPIRNDPPPLSSVGALAKNRFFLRDDANPNTFYFSALGEVKGLLNGAAEESFPGYGTNTISDVVNSDFIPDLEIRAICEHENIIFVFGTNATYALIGELNLLDNRAPRSLIKLRQFSENCAGADAAVSTPYGLAWMNSGRRIWLWQGGTELLDIGRPIQSILDTIPATEIRNTYLTWYSGNGRQWLVVNCRASAPDDEDGAAEQHRTLVYDFGRAQQGGSQPGLWFEWTDILGTAAGVFYDDDGLPFLLIGDSLSTVKQADVVADPCHLETSSFLGKCYLSSSVSNNPAAVLRTGLILPTGDSWTVGNYIQLLTGDQDGAGTPRFGSLSDPTIGYRVDIENPDRINIPGPITLTLDTATTSGDKRAWLIPEAAATGTSGPNSPDVTAEVANVGGSSAWATISNVTASDDAYATTAMSPPFSSRFIYATDYDFAIPENEAVAGILVEVEAKTSDTVGTHGLAVSLIRGGVRESTSKSVTTLTTSDAYYSFGGATDLWSSAWSAQEINDIGFGAALVATNAAGAKTISIDHIRITVYTSANTNVGGAFGKQFVFQASYAAGNDATGETDSRLTTRQNSLYKMGFTYVPEKEQSR